MGSRSQLNLKDIQNIDQNIQNKDQSWSHQTKIRTIKTNASALGFWKASKDPSRQTCNTFRIPLFPKPNKGCEKRKPFSNRINLTVIGNRVTKEFIYCVKMVQGMHKYRWQAFGAPIVRGVTDVEWPLILNDLKIRYGGLAHCCLGQVAVLHNGSYIGGEKELKDFIEERYIYHMALNYPKESVDLFRIFLRNTGRPCAYMHIAVDDEPIGSLLYMLYSDICPKTCENFLRLCQTTKGGYSGTPVHRIVEDGWIQCGGFGLKDTPLGCENFIVPHDRRGVIGMCNDNRGVDCSTQFYILLQPALWMNHKYVAFGQLIDGNGTLKKIEGVSTFYESPSKNITIFKAGLLNLECDDIMINRGAVAFIDAHIDDLVSISEMLSEWLWQLVEAEIEAKHLRLMAMVVAEVMGIDSQTRNVNDGVNIPPTDRMNDFEPNPLGAHKAFAANQSMNSEFYGEDQFLYKEGYHQATALSSEIKLKRPYYIPLTDVLYPGERDSNYDLKRFLQGDYCLQSDLDPKQSKRIYTTLRAHREQLNTISGMILSYNGAMEVIADTEDDSSSLSLAEEDIKDESEKLWDNEGDFADKVSFAGTIVKNMGKKYVTKNFLEKPQVTFADEEIRRMRLALQDLRSQVNKKVSISISPWETHSQIKRRQTGVSLPMMIDVEEEEDQIDEEFKINKGKHASISDAFKLVDKPSKIQRRPTKFVRVQNMDAELDEIDELDIQEEQAKEKKEHASEAFKVADGPSKIQRRPTKSVKVHNMDAELNEIDEVEILEEQAKEKKEKVRIAPESIEYHEIRPPTKMYLTKNHGAHEDDRPQSRPSVLVRLYENVGVNSDDIFEPTLKDYKPKEFKKDLMLSSTDDFKSLLRKETHRFSQQFMDTVDNAERRTDYAQSSLKSGTKRPTLTISAYKLKNLQYVEKMKEEKKKKETAKLKEEHLIAKMKSDYETLTS